MFFCQIKWPKSEDKPKFGVDEVCHGDAVPPMYRFPLPNVKLVVQPRLLCSFHLAFQTTAGAFDSFSGSAFLYRPSTLKPSPAFLPRPASLIVGLAAPAAAI